MATPAISLTWSASFAVAAASPSSSLPGDKILLPQKALEQLLAASTVTVPSANNQSLSSFDPFNPYSLAAARHEQSQWRDTQQQLPHPLTFRLVNPKNGNVVYAGIREFSADEGEIVLSPFLREALGIEETYKPNGTSEHPIDLSEDAASERLQITVHAKQLPKGQFVRLRPLEAGYNPDDWKSLLERHLRENFTTLTNGEILVVPGVRGPQSEFRFLIDKFLPEGDGICVVDTDLEVDIEALNEDQARETVKRIVDSSRPIQGSSEESSGGGDLNIWKPTQGQIRPGDYVDYQLPSWDRSQGLEIELTTENMEGLDLLVSPFSSRQRVRPRLHEHTFARFDSDPVKRVFISSTNIEMDGAESIYVTVHAYRNDKLTSESTIPFSIGVRSTSTATVSSEITQEPEPGQKQCKNCHQWVPERTMMLHENFCYRNNTLCPHCQKVFKKNSAEWTSHWHCPLDTFSGETPLGKLKHDDIFHTAQQCSNCPYEAANVPDLAHHRATVCPGKLILCQFCHLEVPQDGDPLDPSPEALISGLTAHELADGSRTTECHLCSKIVRLRDMATHLKHHDLEKLNKPKPRICIDALCGRTLDGAAKNGEIGSASRMGQGPGNDLGLCSICFGPLYVSMHDPDGKAMKRRVERRYISQLIQGCGKSWCKNPYCKTGKKNTGMETATIGTKEALPMVKPLMEGLANRNPMWFCVDEGSQQKRTLAEMLAGEDNFDLEWCIAALEAEGGNLDAARRWLANWAPTRTSSS